MYTKTFCFKNYTKASSSILVYDASKSYEPFVKDYLHILSCAIEHMECGDTSRYKNIMEGVNLEKYYDIENSVLEQTLYGYIWPQEFTNEQWFRILKSVIINYKILSIVFDDTIDLNEHYPMEDMASNSYGLSKDLQLGTEAVRREYADCLPEGIDLSTWPAMNVVEFSENYYLDIKLADDCTETDTEYYSQTSSEEEEDELDDEKEEEEEEEEEVKKDEEKKEK
ncbi:ORF67 [Leucania separata nucleopolyhedrovirus]|uniref:ORF67 n=1 Tax=Leucania separata nucleopolyhedrovirus TaxID=1307956 RepID=Q0IL52_NPVLS|nr:ORF67 [Leucania separata nucleopolyhedrovirus]AAR28831.1 ORF67 [Leucania separata nucleopolyhedrovirus]